MTIDYLDFKTDKFITIHAVKSFRGANSFSFCIDLEITFENDSKIIIPVKAFQSYG